jgi:hypothetical protein
VRSIRHSKTKIKVMTTSKQIVRTIAEMANDNEQMTKSILGKFVVEECVKLNEKPFIFKEVKPLIDSCSFLVKQIEMCSDGIEALENKLTTMKSLNDEGFVFPYEPRDFDKVQESLNDTIRQKELFTKQLIESIEKI